MTPALPSYTVRIETPDGTLFVHITETGIDLLPNQVDSIRLDIGKTGYSLRAWADALARIVTLALRRGVNLQEIINEVSNITTDKSVKQKNGASIKSGPEGLAMALIKYQQHKQKEKESVKKNDEPKWRPPRFNKRQQ